MRQISLALFAVLVLFVAACGQADVTIYCALDQVHSGPFIRKFEEKTGLTVKAQYDLEAVKTVGLVNRIVDEESNPKCDVFWNNELVHTVRLKKMGLLAPYQSPSAADIPDRFKDAEGYWTGFAARARVLILNTDLATATFPDQGAWPTATKDLLDPKWKGQVGMAKPLAGTTLTHMSVLWSMKGPDFVKAFWTGFTENGGKMATGNANLMKLVSDGRYTFGYTDTDDCRKAQLEGKPVKRIFPDQALDGDVVGCLVIPNSVSLIKNGPNPENGKALIDFILSIEVEEALANGPSAQMPVRKSVPRPDYVKSAEELVTMDVDWEKVADAVEPANAWLLKYLGTRK
jgi:iron(III) transport system substrate-binding protein